MWVTDANREKTVSTRIEIFDHTAKRLLYHEKSRTKAEAIIQNGKGWLLSSNPFQVALYKPKAKKRVWAAAPSLTVPPGVILKAADGIQSAIDIVDGYKRGRYEKNS